MNVLVPWQEQEEKEEEEEEEERSVRTDCVVYRWGSLPGDGGGGSDGAWSHSICITCWKAIRGPAIDWISPQRSAN